MNTTDTGSHREGMRKNIGYVIVMDGHAVRHEDTNPYWLQWSSYCELYPTYKAARSDMEKERRKLKAMLKSSLSGRPPLSTLNRWIQTLRIIPVRHRSPKRTTK